MKKSCSNCRFFSRKFDKFKYCFVYGDIEDFKGYVCASWGKEGDNNEENLP